VTDLVDIGANLTHESFADDLSGILERARSNGVGRLIVTGTSLAGSAAAWELASSLPGRLWCTAGIHPHHADEFSAAAASDLNELLLRPNVVAVGECGLDYFRDFSPRPSQRAAFAGQLALAAKSGKPLFLHERDAHGDFLAMLHEYWQALAGGVAHCFTGGPAELERYLELGLHVGITGWICDERRGSALRDAAARLPLDRVLLETDAPYLLPRSLDPAPKTRRNEPAYLPEILRVLARCMGQDEGVIAQASSRNAERLFGLSSAPP
jgi:TatD DNase family protein